MQYTRWEVTPSIRKLWSLQPDGTQKSTDITEVEAVGPLLALQTWPELTDGLWLHWIDNDAARSSLVRGSSSVMSLNSIALETWSVVKRRLLYLWVERVHTKDNPTDGISWGDMRDTFH